MATIGVKEALYMRKHLREVKHVTLNPGGADVLRIHMIPPRRSLKRDVPSALVVNGQDIVPLNLSWVILLSAFIDGIAPFDGKEMKDGDWDAIVGGTVKSVRKVYPRVQEQTLKDDLWHIINTLHDIARGKTPEAEIGRMSIGEYAAHMRAPHRMDLMISSMAKGGGWNCNQKCLHCYAAGQGLSSAEELPTHAWKEIIDRCREAGIPQLTFTGGEPTLRDDLVELVAHSKWFITRLNTNGVLLTKELCTKLYEASLDSVQVTLYSADAKIHNALVGAENWERTVEGIRNALAAGLSVSVNTPLCKTNGNYPATLEFLHSLGVRYVTCSGLIPAGNAREEASVVTRLAPGELRDILTTAHGYCKDNHIDINFTSPGWLGGEQLREIGFASTPTCGACLSNMAVAPDGKVIPCQSWLSGGALGSMLTDPWPKIWDGPECRRIRGEAGKMEHRCLLRAEPEARQ